MNLNQRNSGKKQFEQLADRIKCEIREICVNCAHYLFKSMRSMNKSNKSHLVFRVLYYIYSQFHTKRMFFFPLLFDMKHSGWQKKLHSRINKTTTFVLELSLLYFSEVSPNPNCFRHLKRVKYRDFNT